MSAVVRQVSNASANIQVSRSVRHVITSSAWYDQYPLLFSSLLVKTSFRCDEIPLEPSTIPSKAPQTTFTMASADVLTMAPIAGLHSPPTVAEMHTSTKV